jgi:hypothetical protein
MKTRTIRPGRDTNAYTWTRDDDSVFLNAVVINVEGANGGSTELVLPMTAHVAKELAWAAGRIFNHLARELDSARKTSLEYIEEG